MVLAVWADGARNAACATVPLARARVRLGGSYCMTDLIVDLLSQLRRRNLRHAVETCAEIFALQLGLCRLMEQIVRA